MSPATRGDGLTHPVVLTAVATLAFNDHVWKGVGPGWLTGKLSDVAGMVFFPLLLQALVEVAGFRRGHRFVPSRRVLAAAVVATVVVFAAVKLVPFAGDVYRHGLGWLGWPLQAGFPTTPPRPVALVRDPTDLLALPATALAWLIGARRVARAGDDVLAPRRASDELTRWARRPSPADRVGADGP